jgi:hypothetical protein
MARCLQVGEVSSPAQRCTALDWLDSVGVVVGGAGVGLPDVPAESVGEQAAGDVCDADDDCSLEQARDSCSHASVAMHCTADLDNREQFGSSPSALSLTTRKEPGRFAEVPGGMERWVLLAAYRHLICTLGWAKRQWSASSLSFGYRCAIGAAAPVDQFCVLSASSTRAVFSADSAVGTASGSSSAPGSRLKLAQPRSGCDRTRGWPGALHTAAVPW